jgi:hypothetical protein
VLTGLLVHRASLQTTGGPPFLPKNEFLVCNALALLTFAGLAAWAIAIRKDTGWHRRLMFCAFAVLTGPGLGRLLPQPFLVPYAWWADNSLVILFPIIGMLADKRRYGRVHPAWFWGVGLFVGLQAAGELFAYSPAGYQFTEWFVQGTPGAQRPMEAFSPPM